MPMQTCIEYGRFKRVWIQEGPLQASVVGLYYTLSLDFAPNAQVAKFDAIGVFSQVGELVGASREKLKALVDKHKD